MTESSTSSSTSKTKPSAWLEFGPLLVFFVAFQILKRRNADEAMLQAAGLFAIVAVIALLISWVKHKSVSPMLILSTVIIAFTAGLAIAFENKTIFYMKPTIVNVMFGAAVIGGVFLNRNVVELLLGGAFEMPRDKWNIIAIRWGLFFFFCAALNEVIWRTQSEDFWVNFKVFGFLPLTLVFTLTQIPFIQKHGKIKDQNSG
ncbi:intracellular septation protein [Litorimonas taeanensis]|uniref:Inner membrane-spanning protein YciB n=1 Tax=Litorimonas taeanensis TaxID=568099 RepID=A0A420WEY8_9PROT|nr:inner membrane-spanning protein YciB [Litorimonas taeanensis]RKQ69550.1 intracellular septation protein [Litorimonas taeanensis]